MPVPTLEIHLDRLRANARAVTALCARHGIEVCGVCKASMGSPLIARAMLEGGVTGIGESRLDNAVRLRRNGITAPLLMLRIPSISEAADVITWTDASLNSEISTLEALSAAAVSAHKVHEVLIMVELGDRREGAPPAMIPALCERVMELPGLTLGGLGTNFMCASGVLPSRGKLDSLARLAESIERRCGTTLRYVSGGNSSSLPLLLDGGVNGRINHLRVGTSILLGENPWSGGTLEGLRRDVFLLEAELVELKVKPSLPEGEIGLDAFGEVPTFRDRGERTRGIVNLGRLDISPSGLRPHGRGIETVTASSDHMILDLTDSTPHEVGDPVDFEIDYASLVQLMLSPYIRKHVVGTGPGHSERQAMVLADSTVAASRQAKEFIEELKELGLSLEVGDSRNAGAAAAAAGRALAERKIPIVLGSQRSRLFPLLRALRGAADPIGLLWVDSHPACDTEGSNVLGEALTSKLDAAPLLAAGCALVGLREATRTEARFLRDQELLALTMEDVDLLGMREVMRRALARVTSLGHGFALCLHGSVIRNMNGVSDAGLSYRECSLAMELVAASGGLRAVALTGIDPETESALQLRTTFGYLLSAFGKRILGV